MNEGKCTACGAVAGTCGCFFYATNTADALREAQFPGLASIVDALRARAEAAEAERDEYKALATNWEVNAEGWADKAHQFEAERNHLVEVLGRMVKHLESGCDNPWDCVTDRAHAALKRLREGASDA